MRRVLTAFLIALAALVGLAAAVVIAWTIDTQRHEGHVARHVQLAGDPVGGFDRPRLAAAVKRVASRYATATVKVEAAGGGFETDAKALGMTVDEGATAHAAMRVGREGGVLGRITGWLAAFLDDRPAPVQVEAPPDNAFAVVEAKDTTRTPPVEPGFKAQGAKLVAVPGVAGKGIDPRALARALPAAAEDGLPITVRLQRGPVAPRFSESDAATLIAEAERITATALPLSLGTSTAKIDVPTLRSWLRTSATPQGLRIDLDQKATLDDLATALPKGGTAPQDARFSVEGGTVKIIAGTQGSGCCSDAAVPKILEALRKRPKDAVEMPAKKIDPSLTTADAEKLKIVEKVGTFMTSHKAGEARVKNIHRIADLARGTVIKPGETYSVNASIGKRTAEKGFVVAGVIQDGVFAEDVGGGVSQFATTLFNAAFFAGLDFGEYQSHSLYISRYPYGREATLGFPHPDLQIKNTTPNGVLLWPTYTGTTITVDLYSTKHVEATQTGQTKAPKGPCTRVVTQRSRKYPDGTTKVDTVSALYRPAEGVNC